MGGSINFWSPIESTKSNQDASNPSIESFRIYDWTIGVSTVKGWEQDIWVTTSIYGFGGLFRLSHKLGLFAGWSMSIPKFMILVGEKCLVECDRFMTADHFALPSTRCRR